MANFARGSGVRVFIKEEPFVDPAKIVHIRGTWPATWIARPGGIAYTPHVTAYRRRFALTEQTLLRIHVSADERYELFLNGRRIGRGPERGTRENWYFESYDLDLAPGEHVLVARVWWLGPYGPAPHAQVTVRPAFLLAAEGVPSDLLDTGVAPWECRALGGYEFLSPEMCWGTGANVFIHGAEFRWGFERGDGDGWEPVEIVSWKAGHELWPATSARYAVSCPAVWMLRPATLPVLPDDTLAPPGVVRQGEDAPSWERMLRGQAPLSIPQNSTRRVLIDLQNYVCAYPKIVLTDGKGATVRILWAESLYDDVSKKIKGNRDQIDGKQFIGSGDSFETDGGAHRAFETLWWQAGRYLEITVTTRDQPLTIESLQLHETHYPFAWTDGFECSDDRFAPVLSISRRTMEMCSHETYLDCPYYEQNQYIGETRLYMVMTYALTGDERLPRKAIEAFDASRQTSGPTSGLTRSLFPNRWLQVIPPYSLWWIAAVHDFAMWRDDVGFVRDRMSGVRSVVDAFSRFINADGLLQAPAGWNFVDWPKQWKNGVPPDGEYGVSAVLNWHLVYTLNMAVQLEELCGEPELAARNRRLAAGLLAATRAAFWDDRRGLFADDLNKQHFSEHAQCLAILAGGVSDNAVAEKMLRADQLTPGTIYFKHYLFEAYQRLGIAHRLFERLDMWFDLVKQGFKTTPERPEPCRSDCHAWAAHPMYHAAVSILGIRPAAAGFATVDVTPQLGPLKFARGKVMHPRGAIEADFRVAKDQLTGHVSLPDGVTGTLRWQNLHRALEPGRNDL